MTEACSTSRFSTLGLYDHLARPLRVLDEFRRAVKQICAATGLRVPKVFSAPGLDNLGVNEDGIHVDENAIAPHLAKMSKEDRWHAIVGIAAHEVAHTFEPRHLPQIERERLADVFAGRALKQLAMPSAPFKRLLTLVDRGSKKHPPLKERLELLGRRCQQLR